MILPNLEELDEVCKLITGNPNATFMAVDYANRATVIAIAQQGLNASLQDQLIDAVVEANKALKLIDKVATELSEIDDSLGPIMRWFEVSRPWDGRY